MFDSTRTDTPPSPLMPLRSLVILTVAVCFAAVVAKALLWAHMELADVVPLSGSAFWGAVEWLKRHIGP